MQLVPEILRPIVKSDGNLGLFIMIYADRKSTFWCIKCLQIVSNIRNKRNVNAAASGL